MKNIHIATAQFENASGGKAYNLQKIEALSKEAAAKGAEMIVFHECSITGYTFAMQLSKPDFLAVAEYIPSGPSIKALTAIAAKHNIVVCAGLFERDENENIYKAYVCVDSKGIIAKYRKLHPFINPHITPGDSYCVFEWRGWKVGILICYDNNIAENVRATKLLGADIILMPHVTMCTPSTRPGAGFVDAKLWQNRDTDPTFLREEFEGLKGRKWLMKWLPARAYDNAVYCIFSNAVGMDGDQLKAGRSMILDPFGDILVECTKLGDDFEIATLTHNKIGLAGGTRYLNARRPALYGDLIAQPHESKQQVAWVNPA